MTVKVKILATLTFAFILIAVLHIPWYYKTKKNNVLKHFCRVNQYTLASTFEDYMRANDRMPASLDELKAFAFEHNTLAASVNPDRFSCPKNKALKITDGYAYTPSPVAVKLRGRDKNEMIILFCKPEVGSGYFNYINADLFVRGGLLDEKEKIRVINLYDTLVRKQH